MIVTVDDPDALWERAVQAGATPEARCTRATAGGWAGIIARSATAGRSAGPLAEPWPPDRRDSTARERPRPVAERAGEKAIAPRWTMQGSARME